MAESPLLCRPEDKDALESRNSRHQIEYVEHWIRYGKTRIGESEFLDLQRLAIEDIYPCGGQFRHAGFDHGGLLIGGSEHSVPSAASILAHVRELIDLMADPRDPISKAAYTLWRVNWIHPFPGGNGRTARALTYFQLCIDFTRMLREEGKLSAEEYFMIPGTPSLPTVISAMRERYIAALQVADTTFGWTGLGVEQDGEPYLTCLERVILGALGRCLRRRPARSGIQSGLRSGIRSGLLSPVTLTMPIPAKIAKRSPDDDT